MSEQKYLACSQALSLLKPIERPTGGLKRLNLMPNMTGLTFFRGYTEAYLIWIPSIASTRERTLVSVK